MQILQNQRNRVIILLLEVGFIVLCSYLGFESLVPPTNNQGLWFYTALFSIIVGSRLLTPYYIKPIDVVAYSAPAFIALIYLYDALWNSTEKALFLIAITICSLLTLMAFTQILSKDSTNEKVRLISENLRTLLSEFGNPQVVYSLVMMFCIYTFHRASPIQMFWIFIAWALTVASSPIETLFKVLRNIYDSWKTGAPPEFFGQVVAYQKPNIILFRETPQSNVSFGMPLIIKDLWTKDKIAIALDYVGRDEGVLRRCVEIETLMPSQQILKLINNLPDKSVSKILKEDITATDNTARLILNDVDNFVGVVAKDTTINLLYFEEIQDGKIDEGRLVKAIISDKTVVYQIVGGKTNEEPVYQKNLNGFTRVEAQKIGVWDEVRRHFEQVKWLPSINAPVFVVDEEDPQPDYEAIGFFPKSNYAAHIKNINDLVTHNTAILGILGVGKSSLSFELIERMLSKNIKVICLDLTDEYAEMLKEFCYTTDNDDLYAKLLAAAGTDGRSQFNAAPEQGGNKPEFADAVLKFVDYFVKTDSGKNLLVFNPAQYEVWRQFGQYFGKGEASMASLSATEVTQLFTEAALKTCQSMGKVKNGEARVCMVYEEAHSLVPEWNTVVNEGDKAGTNGTARAILQGRKFGLGCLLISQRTANVTKTILNQCNTVFAMRTFDDTGISFLSNYLGKQYAETLPTLPERHAVFFGKASKCENPIIIRLNDREDFKKTFREKFPIPEPEIAETKSLENITSKTATTAGATGAFSDFDDDIPF
jgi:uncharacterized protein